MSVAYMNGFDIYSLVDDTSATSKLNNYGDTCVGSSLITGGRYGGRAMGLWSNGAYFQTKSFPVNFNVTQMIIGFNVKVQNSASTSSNIMIRDFNNSVNVNNFRILGQNLLDVGGVTQFTFTTGQWYHVQIETVYNPAGPTYNKKLYIDGVQIGSNYPSEVPVATPAYVKIVNSATALSAGNALSNAILIDDLYIIYEDNIIPGSLPTPAIRVESLKPSGDAFSGEWSANSGSTVAAVSGIPPDSNLWIHTDANNKKHMFHFEDLVNIQTPLWSQTKTIAKSTLGNSIGFVYHQNNVDDAIATFVASAAPTGIVQFLPSGQTLNQINAMKMGYISV